MGSVLISRDAGERSVTNMPVVSLTGSVFARLLGPWNHKPRVGRKEAWTEWCWKCCRAGPSFYSVLSRGMWWTGALHDENEWGGACKKNHLEMAIFRVGLEATSWCWGSRGQGYEASDSFQPQDKRTVRGVLSSSTADRRPWTRRCIPHPTDGPNWRETRNEKQRGAPVGQWVEEWSLIKAVDVWKVGIKLWSPFGWKPWIPKLVH